MKNFRTYQLALELYKASRKHKLSGHYKDQFDRAMLSIPLNLAEGSGKGTMKDKKRFYFIALGSFREVECMIDLFEMNEIKEQANRLGGSLFRLCHSN